MSNLRKKALWLALLGVVLGIGVGLMFYVFAGPGGFLAQEENRLAMFMYFLLCGLYGAVNMGTSAVYDIESWSILRCTLTHFGITLVSTVLFFGTMILLGWLTAPPAGVCLLAAAAYVVIYFLIWLAQYLSYRKKVRKMNATLRKWKNRR